MTNFFFQQHITSDVPGYYVAFVIRNQYIADHYVEWFDELWKEGKS